MAAGRRPFEAAVGVSSVRPEHCVSTRSRAAVRSGCEGPLGSPATPGWGGGRRRAAMVTRIAVLVLGAAAADGWTAPRALLLPPLTRAFRLSRPWTLTKNWCDVVKEPAWPFAYQKWEGSLWERKGRGNVLLNRILYIIL